MQTGWRWCYKCQGAFFAGNPGQGICPSDHKPHDASQSGAYAMIFGGDSGIAQGGWRWCNKCQGLFFTGNPSQGVCPADSLPHDGRQSGQYAALINNGLFPYPPLQLGQPGWRWCRKCQGFFYGGNPSQGVCPADKQAHDGRQSFQYGMPWDIPLPTSVQYDSGWLTSGLPLGGSAQVVMKNTGDYDYHTHAHDSGFDNINYTISAVVMTSDAFAFTIQHASSTEGTIAGLPFGTPNRDDDFQAPAANNPLIASHWDGIVHGQFSARIDGTDTIVAGIEGVLGDMVKALAAKLGEGAAAGLIALV